MRQKPFLLKGVRNIKVSSKSARLRFIACGPDCIAKGCTSKCCDAPTHPDGVRIHVLPEEAKPLRKLGAAVTRGFLQPKPGCRVCPFKTEEHLCGLWQRPERPFGCIVSPFMLNSHGTLIIRNRYKLLPCYDPENGQPAYKVFKSSLEAIFGEFVLNTYIYPYLEAGKGDIIVAVPVETYDKLQGREHALRSQ